MSIRALQILMLWLPCVALPIQAQVSDENPVAVEISRGELDQMLAPIALYPDTVLSHVLIAATYPLEVIQAHRWSRDNSRLDGSAAVRAVENQNWDPSIKALVAFPDLLERMSEDLEWTQRLGEAFLVDESKVMDAIQDLREKAYATGSLESMQHIQVQREERTIIIEPAVERVVYIPYYDTREVYGNWWWSDYPPMYWRHPHNHVFVGGHYWGPRISLGSTFFFTSFHWPQRRVVHIDYRHKHYPPLYSSRKIAHFDHARHWRHNPVHRRGVSYRYNRLQELYHHRANSTSLQDRRRIRHTDRDERHTIAPRNQPVRQGRTLSDSRKSQSIERSQHIRQRLGADATEAKPNSAGRPRLRESRAIEENVGRPGRAAAAQQSERSGSTSPAARFSNREHNDKARRDYRSSQRDNAPKAVTGMSEQSPQDRNLSSRRELLRDRQSVERSGSPRSTTIDRARRPAGDIRRSAPAGRAASTPNRRFEGRPTRER